MANWKALAWSETVKTGRSQARAVLTMLCLKATDDGKVWSDATRIADLCELSTRRLHDWRDYLHKHSFITVVRRVRPNGSEAKPVTLLNYPEAPHLKGEPVRLDYDGKYLYPRDPDGLRQAGITWISAEGLGGIHPSHQPDKLSGWQRDSSSGCATSENAGNPQDTQHDSSSGCQPDSSSPPGADNSSGPRQSPFQGNPQPTKTAAPKSSATATDQLSNDGWMNGSYESENKRGSDTEADPRGQSGTEQEGDSPGARLLRSLRAQDGTGLAAWAVPKHAGLVDNYLGAGHTAQQVTEHLTTGMRSAGGIQSKLTKLANGSEQLPSVVAAGTSSGTPLVVAPEGCAACLGGWITDEHGRDRKCPTCIPAPAAV